ncbi:MAG: NAD-dependent epimerase/dehydratase family protein [Armatimonadota bacterium]|jgi:UDP-glucose 4-epimerase
MKVLLTGGSGLVGLRLAPMLAERHEVTHFEMREPGDDLPWIEGDLLDPEAIRRACEGMEAVVHVAAIHGANWRALGDHAMFEANVMGTQNVVDAAVRAGARRVVFTSSISATGHGQGPPPPWLPIDEEIARGPADLYGQSKALGEQICRFATERHGLSTIILRPGYICDESTQFPDTLRLMSFMVDVRDVARAHLAALECEAEVHHGAFLVTADSPLARIEPLRFFADRRGCLDELVPGIGAYIDDGTLDPRSINEWYTVDRARWGLGWEPEHNFELP